jgi:hypothetical protein
MLHMKYMGRNASHGCHSHGVVHAWVRVLDARRRRRCATGGQRHVHTDGVPALARSRPVAGNSHQLLPDCHATVLSAACYPYTAGVAVRVSEEATLRHFSGRFLAYAQDYAYSRELGPPLLRCFSTLATRCFRDGIQPVSRAR